MKKTILALSIATICLMGCSQHAQTNTCNAQVAANKAFVLKLTNNIWNKRNAKLIDAYVSPAFKLHNIAYKQVFGIADIKTSIPQFFKAFPDMHFTVKDMVSEGNQIMYRWQGVGTQMGPFHGHPATFKPVHYAGISVLTIEHNKIVSSWVSDNMLDLFPAR